MNQCFTGPIYSKNNVKLEADLASYAKKAELSRTTGVDKSKSGLNYKYKKTKA